MQQANYSIFVGGQLVAKASEHNEAAAICTRLYREGREPVVVRPGQGFCGRGG